MQENPSGPPQPPTIISTYHLRVIFFQYETTYLLTHLESYLKQIQRHCPEFQLELPTMEIYHSLIQFQSTPMTKIPAYQQFPIKVQLIHSFNPSQLYFLAILDNQETLFPQSFQLLNPLQKSGTKTLLALNTNSGTLLVPSHHPPHQQDNIEIFSLTLSTCLESLQFSESPFKVWKSVESSFGHLHFPTNMSILAALPPVQYSNPLSYPPPAIPHQKNLRWSGRAVNQTVDHNYLSPIQNAPHPSFHQPEMEHQHPLGFPHYPSGIRSLPPSHNTSVQTQHSDNLPFHTDSTNYHQIPTSDIQASTPLIPGVPQPSAPLRPKMSFAVPSALPELRPPAPTDPPPAHRLPGPASQAHLPSYVEANPSSQDYRHEALHNITSHLNQMSDTSNQSTDIMNRFNALRGTSPLLPTPSVQVPTTVTIPTQAQQPLINDPTPPPRHQTPQRMTPFFTSTPRHDSQSVPVISQAQALPSQQLSSQSVPLYKPPSIPSDLVDQFHHQSTLHDDTTITPTSPTDNQPAPKVTVKYTDGGACGQMEDLRKQKQSDPQPGSRATLDAMCLLLEKYPKNNQFENCRHFSSDLPPKPIYTLSNNHQTYLNGILHQMNDHQPPTNIATLLAPYVSYDINHRRYRAVENLLTLEIIQKLDHLINSSIAGPSTFQRLKDKFTNHTRSSSK